jgi:type II secretory pathway component GspD/PulD (secretin)
MCIGRIVALFAVVCLTAFASVNSDADSPKELAMALARKAKRAEKDGENAQAYIWYAEAAALEPSNRGYKGHMEALQSRAVRDAARSKTARAKADEARLPEPALGLPEPSLDDVFDSLTEKEEAEARELKELPVLHGKPGKQNIDLTGDGRTLFEKVAQSFGLDTVFDGDYPKTGPAIRFHVSGADYREAIHDLEAATGSFVIPLSGRVFMVAQDTPPKRNDLEQTMEIAVPVPQATTTQELTELGQVMRQATNIEKIAWQSAQSRIVMKDRVSRVVPAVALLNELMAYRPEVMVDLEFIQLSKSDMVNYGFNVTHSFTGIYLGQILNNVVSAPSNVTSLLTFGAGKTLIGITAAQVQAMFNETRSDTKSLYRAQLRAEAGQPSSLHVGEKYPVITGGYIGTVPAGQTVYAPPPSFTFVDLGLELKVTPFVNGDDVTTLAVETTFQVLTGSSVNSIPVIGNRSTKSQVTVRNGEWAVIGTVAGETRSKAVSGFWGLAQIPFLGELFKQTSTDNEDSNVLIGIRTHLLSLPASEKVARALRMGSDSRPFTPL